MPEPLGFEPLESRSPGAEPLSWEPYLDGQVWAFTEGEDFTGTAEQFRNRAFSAGSRHSLRAVTRKERRADGRLVMKVQFVPLD